MDNVNFFQEVKERISMPDIVKGYGIDINRSGFCLCPFHAEKTPSMKIYDKGFKCFGCGEGGDMFVFVQKLFNLSSVLEACKKINEDFGLNINVNHKPTKQEFISAKNLAEERKKFEQAENKAFELIADYHKLLMDYGTNYKPQLGEVPDIRFIEYLTQFERCEIVFEEMLEVSSRSMQERKEYLESSKDYFVHISEKLENAKNSKAKAKEIANAFEEGDIIGTVLYKAIPEKSYLKYSNIVAPMIAKKLEEDHVKFSGRVYSKLTTFTISKCDMEKVRDIARGVTDKFTERNRPQLIPTQKQQQQQRQQEMTNRRQLSGQAMEI